MSKRKQMKSAEAYIKKFLSFLKIHLDPGHIILNYLFLLFITAFVFNPVFAQDIVMDYNPEELYKDPEGPQAKNYFHPYISFGFIPDFSKPSNSRIENFYSNDLSIGLRYKRKIFSFYQLGFDISARSLLYKIKNESASPEELNPFSQFRDKGNQYLKINSIGAEFYNRFRAGKGNNLGYYIDCEIRADLNYINKWIIKSKNDSEDNPVGKVKIINRKLDFIEKTGISLSGRLGFKKFILYANYRFTELFKDNYEIREFPKISSGFQLAF